MADLIYISPSDQTENLYAVGNTNEGVQCHRIADATEAAMIRCGINAKANKEMAISKAIKESNALGAKYHICEHTNAFDGKVIGTRIMYFPGNKDGYALAQKIMARLAPITPGNSDNITMAEFGEMRNTTATCVYIETGFHDNKEEAQWIIDHVVEIGEAICMGVCDHLGIAYVPPVASVTAQTPAPKEQIYRVQVGAYKIKSNAEAMKRKLKEFGFDGFIVEAEK